MEPARRRIRCRLLCCRLASTAAVASAAAFASADAFAAAAASAPTFPAFFVSSYTSHSSPAFFLSSSAGFFSSAFFDSSSSASSSFVLVRPLFGEHDSHLYYQAVVQLPPPLLLLFVVGNCHRCTVCRKKGTRTGHHEGRVFVVVCVCGPSHVEDILMKMAGEV